MKQFIVIGIEDGCAPFFSPEVSKHIRQGTIFSGGNRHREIVADLLPKSAQWIPVTVPLEKVFLQYETAFKKCEEQNQPASILVFASGDPLFFGFANTLRRKMPQAEILVFPTFNSLQTLAHRLVMPYDDMRTVSLTGRPWQELDRALMERCAKIGILTDREHTPVTIAARLIAYGYTNYTMYVGEHLGHPEKERIRCLGLEEAAAATFEHPNNLLLVAEQLPPKPFGIPDEAFALLHERSKMITKAPIRLLSLQALELNRRQVLWDIGFCTGSVSIEARLQFPHLTVIAFEIREEGRALMKTNSRRFGTPGITTLIGDFLELETESLPRPDAVFIGGHGGKLPDILQKVKQQLQPGGCVVFNSVTPESKTAFAETSDGLGWHLHPSLRITVNEYNPIEIMKATDER